MARILIADDSPRNRLLLRHALADAGHTLLEAPDGDTALAMAIAHRPHLAILDIEMPGRSGLEACRAIRRQPGLAGVRVIVNTGRGLPSDAADARAAGADAFLAKPFRPAQLVAAVAALLGEAELQPGPAIA